MRQFDKLQVHEQRVINSRFVLPEDTSGVEVDKYDRPFHRVSGALVGCTVKNDNFHIHENKNR